MSDVEVEPFGANVQGTIALAGTAGLTSAAIDTIPAATTLAGSALLQTTGTRVVVDTFPAQATTTMSLAALNNALASIGFHPGTTLSATALDSISAVVGQQAGAAMLVVAINDVLDNIVELATAAAFFVAADFEAGAVGMVASTGLEVDADSAPSTSPDHVEYTNTVLYQNLQPRHAALATQSQTTQYLAQLSRGLTRQAQRRTLPITQFNFRGR